MCVLQHCSMLHIPAYFFLLFFPVKLHSCTILRNVCVTRFVLFLIFYLLFLSTIKYKKKIMLISSKKKMQCCTNVSNHIWSAMSLNFRKRISLSAPLIQHKTKSLAIFYEMEQDFGHLTGASEIHIQTFLIARHFDQIG